MIVNNKLPSLVVEGKSLRVKKWTSWVFNHFPVKSKSLEILTSLDVGESATRSVPSTSTATPDGFSHSFLLPQSMA